MARRQHGLTLVELLVGMVIGLLLTAIALVAMTQHLRENHRLLVEARLAQDLQALVDLVSRDLRRASAIEVDGPQVRFHHAGSSEELAFRLQEGVVAMKIGAGSWQAMTDAQTLRVSSLRFTPQVQEIALEGACRLACEEAACPRQQRRSVELQLTARAVHDPAWTSSTTQHVQLRHDLVVGACPP